MSRHLLTLFRVMSNKSKKKKTVPSVPPDSTANDDEPIHKDKAGNVCIRILAKPGAKHNGIIDISAEGVGVQIAAPPSEGEANTELIKYLSKVLRLRKSDLHLDKGLRSRHKLVIVNKGISTPEAIRELICAEMIT